MAVGHSAGGQLALWAARDTGVAGVVSLAGVTDLARAAADPEMRADVAALVGGDPDERAEALAEASPIAGLPLGIRVIAVHGAQDALVAIEHSRSYVDAARAAGDYAELFEVPRADDRAARYPEGPIWPSVRDGGWMWAGCMAGR